MLGALMLAAGLVLTLIGWIVGAVLCLAVLGFFALYVAVFVYTPVRLLIGAIRTLRRPRRERRGFEVITTAQSPRPG